MEILIGSNDAAPIYEQIVCQIKKAIMKKEILPGEILPSIRSLARELEISVITTKRAYEELEKQGMIRSVAGKGFYVQEPDRGKLREEQICRMEERLTDVIYEAKEIGLSLEEMQELLEMLYEGGR